MPFTGSLTYTRLFVEGDVAEDFRQHALGLLALHVMKPLQPEQDVSERSGWCAPGDPYGLTLHAEQVWHDDTLCVGFRTDRWAISASLLRANVQAAEAAYLAQAGRARLRPSERTQIKQAAQQQLRQQSVPSVRAIELAWSLPEGLVRFFSHAPGSIAAMTDLFERTFGLRLVVQTPSTLAVRLGLSEPEETWQTLEPTLLGTTAEV